MVEFYAKVFQNSKMSKSDFGKMFNLLTVMPYVHIY